jgi:hypothetical protein
MGDSGLRALSGPLTDNLRARQQRTRSGFASPVVRVFSWRLPPLGGR